MLLLVGKLAPKTWREPFGFARGQALGQVMMANTGRKQSCESGGRKRRRGREFVGSFEKAVPVIFKLRTVQKSLFPWLLTGLYPFRSASERADAWDCCKASAKIGRQRWLK